MAEWRRCPGGPAVDVDTRRMVARCPSCDFTFSTLMDEPVLPEHWFARDGEVVLFGPDPRCE